jgi:hypothetical protein
MKHTHAVLDPVRSELLLAIEQFVCSKNYGKTS